MLQALQTLSDTADPPSRGIPLSLALTTVSEKSSQKFWG